MSPPRSAIAAIAVAAIAVAAIDGAAVTVAAIGIAVATAASVFTRHSSLMRVPPARCERHPFCTRGYRHGGAGGRCSLAAAKPPATEPDAAGVEVDSPLAEPKPETAELKPPTAVGPARRAASGAAAREARRLAIQSGDAALDTAPQERPAKRTRVT